MKVVLETFMKESEEKKACTKLQEEKIARLTRKLEKWPARSFIKKSKTKEQKASVQSETSNEEVHSKKGGQLKNDRSPGSMTVKQIQDLIVNAIKAHLGADVRKIHLYIMPYTNKVDALCMHRGYQPTKSSR